MQLNHPTTRSGLVAVATLATLLVVTSSASAITFDNIVPNANYPLCGYVPCQTDNASLTVYREGSIGPIGWAHIQNVLTVQYNPTDLNVIYASSPVYTGSSETDIIYRVNASVVPSGSVGITDCDDMIYPVKCDQQYVTFLSGSITAVDTVICHETGHAVGLLHGHDAAPSVSNTDLALGCMITPYGSNQQQLGIGAHNISMINGVY